MKLYGSLRELVAAVFRKDTREITLEPNAGTYSGAVNIKLPPVLTGSDVLVSEAGSQSLTNKTIDADLNTVSNIDDGNIKAGAGIDASKIGAGSVDNTEFGYLNGVTSGIQTQLGSKASSGANSDITSLSGLTTALSTGQGGTGVNSTATFPSSGVVITEAGSATLTNKTIDGDTNTVQDLGLSSLKTVLADANKAILRDAAGAVTSALIANDNVSATAAIADTKLATISTAGKVSNSATTATPLYTTLAPTPNTIVSRDGSGSTSLGGLGVVGNLTTNNFEATGQSLMKFAYINGSTGNGFIEMEGQQVGDIVAPTSGEARLFAGTDGKIYVRKKGSSQAEELGAGGSGEINLVDNSSDAGNWGVVNATATTNTTAANNPLSGTIDTSIAIASSTSGGYARYRFSMPSALKQRKLKLEWYQIASSLTSGAYKVEVWTNAASDYSGAYTELSLSTDSSGTSNIPNLNGKYSTTFDTNGSDYYEIRIVRTAASAATIYIANVVCGPGIQPQGAVVGEWTSYTPTVSNLGAGTVSTSVGYYRRVGSALEAKFTFTKDGTPGTGGTTVTVSLPAGVSIDFTKISTDEQSYAGSYDFRNGGSPNTNNPGSIKVTSGSSTTFYFQKSGATVAALSGADFPATARIEGTITLPIAEWAGSGTVQLAQNDVEYASNNSPTATTNDTTNFVYGPSGSSIPTVVLSGNITKQVRFQTPIQTGDTLTLEVFPSNGFGWVPVIGGVSADSANRTIDAFNAVGTSGIGSIKAVSATDAVVTFGRYRSSTGNWTEITESVKWRVRKSSAGAAVGFGIVSPGTSAGLVSAAGLPGNTTGNAIASGYVGEAPAPSSYSSNYAVGSVNLITLTLNKGVYLILARGEVFTQNLRFGISISTTSATTDLNTRAIATAVTGQLANSQSTFRVVVISADNTPVYIVGQSYDGTVTASGWAQYIRIA